MLKKQYIFFWISLLNATLCLSQDPAHREEISEKKNYPKANRSGIININAGIGASLFTWVASGYNLGEGGIEVINHTPACNLTADYTILSWFSLGLAGTYESATDHPYDGEGNWINSEVERITRYNTALRILFHFAKHSNNDSYSGFRVGSSIWTDEILSTTTYVYSNYTYTPAALTLSSSQQIKPSIQVLYGYIHYLSPAFGLHFEAGIGTPYYIEGGVTLKLNIRPTK